MFHFTSPLSLSIFIFFHDTDTQYIYSQSNNYILKGTPIFFFFFFKVERTSCISNNSLTERRRIFLAKLNVVTKIQNHYFLLSVGSLKEETGPS